MTLPWLLPIAVLAASPRAAIEDERAALLRGHLAPFAQAGRGKPDEVGAFDITSLRIEAVLPADSAPLEAGFQLRADVRQPLGGVVSLLAIDWRPLAIVDGRSGLALDFQDTPDAAEVLVFVPDTARPGDELVLHIQAALDLVCTDPVHCQVRDEPRHLVQFGWYPAAWENPLDDRFALALNLASETALCLSGEPLEGPFAEPGPVALHPAPSTLPGLLWGALARDTPGGSPFIAACYAADQPAQPGRLAAIARVVAGYLEDLFGPYPFARLTLGMTANVTGAGLSPMEMVLLPAFVWTRNGPEGDALRHALLGHELAHQYFFNHLGITAPADAWLSEGMAEYAACRYQEALTDTDDAFRLNYWGYVLGVPSETDAPVHSEQAVQSRDAFEIVYQKASALLRRLERRIDRTRLDALLSTFVARHVGQIATTEELLAVLQEMAGQPQRALFERELGAVDVTWIEATATPGRGRVDPSRLRLPIRPRRGPPEPTPIHLYSGEGPPEVLEVLPGDELAPLEIPASAKWVRVDPELVTFRRVRPVPVEDVNLTGVVDGMDLLDVLSGAGRTVPDPQWDDRLDVDGDDVVDDRDAAAILSRFGQGWSAQ